MTQPAHEPSRWMAWPRAVGWCSRADVLTAFKIVGEEIRTKLQRFASEGLTLGQACDLARRIKDQRDLIRQVADRRNAKHARRLMRLNRKLKERLLELGKEAGLQTTVLIFR